MTLSQVRSCIHTRGLRLAIVAAVAGGLAGTAVANPVTTISRVRSSSPYITTVIKEAAERSTTFRRLVETIDATNGIVFVEQGDCGHSVHSCLLHDLVLSGGNRILRIVVDTRPSTWDLMGAIGHELYHATEVLAKPSLTTAAAVYFFYAPGGGTLRNAFETDPAVRAGLAVRQEVQRPFSTVARP
jgi:hypothetical protein